MDAPAGSIDYAVSPDRQAMARVRWRLVSFLCLLFIVNYLDRTNVAMAKLTMVADVHLSDKAYGLGAGLFFVGYFLFEVPSNLILHRVGASRWIARIMISWGLCSAAMVFTRGRASFFLLRFLLGVAEAGFFPGIVYYLTHWVPATRRAAILSTFLTSTALSGLIGNPLAGWIMQLDGVMGLHGWQWLFLLEGIPPVVLAVAMLALNLLPDTPADARWLTEDERIWIEQALAREREQTHVGHVTDLRAAVDGRLLLLSVIYFMLVMGLYGFIYWVPTIVKGLSGASTGQVGLLSAIPYLVAVLAMVAVGAHADRAGERRRHVAACAALGTVGMIALCASHGTAAGIVSLSVAAIGIFAALGPFWSIPTRYLRGTAAAGGIAVINSAGALAGFVAPSAIGWAKSATGHFTAGLLVVAASLAAGAVLILFVPTSADART